MLLRIDYFLKTDRNGIYKISNLLDKIIYMLDIVLNMKVDDLLEKINILRKFDGYSYY